MSLETELPRGFAAHTSGNATLVAASGSFDALKRAGLDRPGRWRELLASAAERGAGRGRTAIVDLAGARARLKRLRRGGLARAVWRDRFPGRRRLLDNLRLPLVAARRGVPTAEPLALLLVEGPPGLYQGFQANREIEGARDLLDLLRSHAPPSRVEVAEVMRVVRRMHDAGLEHRDLNLGNLLLQRSPAGVAAFVVDWDRARCRPTPLPFGPRLRALRRLERSQVKNLPAGLGATAARSQWYELYAAGDRELAQRLLRARLAGDLRLFLRRLGGLR